MAGPHLLPGDPGPMIGRRCAVPAAVPATGSAIMRLALLLLLCLGCLIAPPAHAQDDFRGTSYVTPFPQDDLYKIQVYGDAFAEGVLGGLVEGFTGEARVQVVRKVRTISGIARADFEDDLRLEGSSSRDPVDIAVVMVGVSDRISIRDPAGKRMAVGSEEWRAEYGRRIDRLIKSLKARNIAVYWIGLPVIRRAEANDDVLTMNEIIREKAFLNGIKYIDAYGGFIDENGGYSPYGPDLAGKIRLLRDGDGILFTAAGNRKLAHFAEREIKRDIQQARSERTISLAGNEAEQKRINPQKAAPAAEAGKASSKDGKGPARIASAVPAGGGEVKADNGRLTFRSINASGREEDVTVELLRPAIPTAVISLVTRRESADRPAQMGDALTTDVGGGLVALSTITPMSASGPGGVPRRPPLTQSPYYKVLVKGEALPPKTGRADDFTWPRPEPTAEPDPPPSPSVRRRPAAMRGAR